MMDTLPPAEMQIVANVVNQDEGGWVLSHDADGGDGGWTFGGVTANNYNRYIHERFPTYASYSHEQMKADIGTKALATIIDNCLKIYVEKFWFPSHCDKLAAEHQQMMFSCAINCGFTASMKVLQAACGCEMVDGLWGPATEMHYAGRLMDSVFINAFCDFWIAHYVQICKANSAKQPFLSGWINRVNRYRKKDIPNASV